eukprot:scaffold687_cov288-Chaetoceros_neogracile.AAC.20
MTSRNCTACSQHRNHPKCLRKATTATSSAIPKGVRCLHCAVRIVDDDDDAACMRGVDCNPEKILLDVLEDEAGAVDRAMAFPARRKQMMNFNIVAAVYSNWNSVIVLTI